jgi:hypothetical protein
MYRPLKELAPALLAPDLIRVDTPVYTDNKMAYEFDNKEFSKLPKHRKGIRFKMPLLIILVIRLASGIHIRIPVYRGTKSFSLDVSSDAEIGIILAGMVSDGGLNLDECRNYEAKRKQLNASEAIN